MESTKVTAFPLQVRVGSVVSSRYPDHKKPLSWDERREGADVVKTDDGKVLKLWSDGGQATPQKGWVLMLSGGDELEGYRWTLYGMPRSS
jgi:hypothetical protein